MADFTPDLKRLLRDVILKPVGLPIQF